MSFLSNNNSQFLSTRITKIGRKYIANGNFKISYFQIGDSEFDYSTPFTAFTGIANAPYQKVFSPFDNEGGIKFPYKLSSDTNAPIYGTPINNSTVETIRNVMGSAGFISNYKQYSNVDVTGTTVFCHSEQINMSAFTGTPNLVVTSGNTYQNIQYITLVLGLFGGTDPNYPILTGNNSSLIYKINSISGNTLTLDRNLPILSAFTGSVQVVINNCENEYNGCTPINFNGQLNPWTLNPVWTTKPIGADVNGIDENLTGYTSNQYVSTKSYLGYSNSYQTFENLTGGSISKPTSFVNTYGEEIEVLPQEQRCIAIVHYSELGNITIDPDRFYKYDDYISYNNSTTNTIAVDNDGNDISDKDYFEVYIPFIYYHRNTGTTFGALFMMDDTDYYLRSTINDRQEILFRYLIDEQGIKVGKVFPNNKTIVFDDQELVAILDYRSNRKYTLQAPKAFATPSDSTATESLLSGSTGQTVWVTYMFSNTGNTQLNGLPCNYYNKVTLQSNGVPSNVSFKFNANIDSLKTTTTGIFSGFTANKFYGLYQLTNTGDLPTSDSWKIIDLTTSAGGNGSNLLNPANISGITFTITLDDYDNATIFDLESYIGTGNYLGDVTYTTQPQFGDEQSFPGSIRLVRASDIETMSFDVNLPSSQFLETQNPTYQNGAVKKITEVALLNDNKEVMVIGKMAVPLSRVGTQILSVKLDF